ncbi:chymotrypsinogen A-like [Argopecten irradians]|uniref:chymotrypsinogen A-like n=1 Tax=Argopecten irradians TaxID=31199 RepID=UPI003719E7E3
MDERWILFVTIMSGIAIQTKAETPVIPPNIIGGIDAPEDAWPWQVALLYKNNFRCGGTILNEDTILTAAHCRIFRSFAKNYQVRIGEYDREKNEKKTRGERNVQVRRFLKHPDYDWFTLENDLAIIKLKTCIKFNKYIQPIPVLADDSMNFIGKTCYTTGWGYIEPDSKSLARKLQQLETPVITNVECQQGVEFTNVTDDMICTNVIPKGACNGDSGGPLQCLINKKWTLVGVASFKSQAICGAGPTGYARISGPNREWIAGKIKTRKRRKYINKS